MGPKKSNRQPLAATFLEGSLPSTSITSSPSTIDHTIPFSSDIPKGSKRSKHYRQTPLHSFIARLFASCPSSTRSCDRERISTYLQLTTASHTMGEEKVRISGENARSADAPILPTVNPASEKPAARSGGIHASVYVMSVSATFRVTNKS